MTNRTREIFDFAQLEPDSTEDLRELVRTANVDELKEIDKVAGNLANAVRDVKAQRMMKSSVESK